MIGRQTATKAILEQCDALHYYYKVATEDGDVIPQRCPFCLAIGLDSARAEMAALTTSINEAAQPRNAAGEPTTSLALTAIKSDMARAHGWLDKAGIPRADGSGVPLAGHRSCFNSKNARSRQLAAARNP